MTVVIIEKKSMLNAITEHHTAVGAMMVPVVPMGCPGEESKPALKEAVLEMHVSAILILIQSVSFAAKVNFAVAAAVPAIQMVLIPLKLTDGAITRVEDYQIQPQ